MRLLLTGPTGQVGFELQRALAPLGIVSALNRTICNLADEASIRRAVRQFRPDVIVNPAAYTAVDKAETERDQAEAINARAPGIFGEEAARIGATVIHYSTDYVFDGVSNGFYRETDPTGPQCIYGLTKLAGEVALAASGAHHIILRTSWVFGAYGTNFAKTMLRLASERDSISVVSDQIGAPTSAALIADVSGHIIRYISRDGQSSASGVYHLVASGETSWYEYARHVIEYARRTGRVIKVPSDAIRPIATVDYPTPAKRPANSRFDTTKLRKTFDLTLPDWKAGVDHVLQQII